MQFRAQLMNREYGLYPNKWIVKSDGRMSPPRSGIARRGVAKYGFQRVCPGINKGRNAPCNVRARNVLGIHDGRTHSSPSATRKDKVSRCGHSIRGWNRGSKCRLRRAFIHGGVIVS